MKATIIFAALLFSSFPSIAQSQKLPERVQPERGMLMNASDQPIPLPEPSDAAPTSITDPNAIYLELLGSGLVYSLNYDRWFANNFSVRIGIGYLPLSTTETNDVGTTRTISASITTVPITLSWYPLGGDMSVPSSKLEIGAGVLYASLNSKSFRKTSQGDYLGYTGIIGYRLQPADGGFLFRIAFTPFILGGHFQPYGGISFGLGF